MIPVEIIHPMAVDCIYFKVIYVRVNFFSQEFINLLTNCSNLPEDILKKAIEFEKSDKLNPPTQKRAKLIPNKDLKKETMKIKQMAEIEEIDTKVDPKKIEQIPLYTKSK